MCMYLYSVSIESLFSSGRSLNALIVLLITCFINAFTFVTEGGVGWGRNICNVFVQKNKTSATKSYSQITRKEASGCFSHNFQLNC